MAAENLLLEGSLAFPSSEATSFDVRFPVLFATGPGDEHDIAQCTTIPNNHTNKQAKKLDKKRELWWDFNLLDQSSPIVSLKLGVAVQFQPKIGSNFLHKTSSILPSEFKVKRCSL